MFNSNYRGKDPDPPYNDDDHKHFADQMMDSEQIKGDKDVMAGVHKHVMAKKKAFTSIAKLREFSKMGGMDADDGNSPSTTSSARKTIDAADKRGDP